MRCRRLTPPSRTARTVRRPHGRLRGPTRCYFFVPLLKMMNINQPESPQLQLDRVGLSLLFGPLVQESATFNDIKDRGRGESFPPRQCPWVNLGPGQQPDNEQKSQGTG